MPCDLVLSFSLNQDFISLYVNDTPLTIRVRDHLVVSINHRTAVRQNMWRPRTQAAMEPRKPIHFDSADSDPVQAAPAVWKDEPAPAAQVVAS